MVAPAANVFTVPSGAAFLDCLATEIARRHGATPLELSAVTVLLPNRRACRALADAFVRTGDGGATLLPAMRPIGDVDESDLALAGTEGEAPADSLELAPAMSSLRRQLLLSQLILTYDSRRRGDGGATMDEAQAAHLAAELGHLLDRVETERLSFAGLSDLVPERFAAHWQGTLDFLKIVTEHWPRILVAEGRIDAAARRNRLIEAQAQRWRAAPSADPVIAAGSTGSVPATAELLDVVCRLPQGSLVLPGLDTTMDESNWESLDTAHPQYGMKELLARIGVPRAEVAVWPGAAAAPRAALLAAAMRPAEATAEPPSEGAPTPESLDGLGWHEAKDSHAEAGFIALLLRGALETPAQTAALITPDRWLARRVAAELGRWGLEIDDSAGVPLSSTPPGTLLGLSAAMIAEEVSPVTFLAALKHPLVAGGMDRAVFRRLVRRFERAALHGPRPGLGFAGLKRALERRAKDGTTDGLGAWLDALAVAAAPMVEAAAARTADLGDLARAHLGFVEYLASDREDSGARRLWAGEAGEEAAAFMSELLAGSAGYPPLHPASYPALLRVLMRGRVVRPRYPRHPRLHIWGPLEGRLQHADLVILGGLNEGTWPAEAAVDPWMSRPMRAGFGLPPPERRTGLAAHDFAQAAAAPTVVLTRAEKVDGTPTVPSRWLVRLRAEVGPAGLAEARREARLFGHWQWLLDRPPPDSIAACQPPAARPPLAARPRKLAATDVEKWMRDPYSIYARRVLDLRALDEIGEEPTARERGNFTHRALERFVAEYPAALDGDALGRLLQFGREAFRAALSNPHVQAFWWPRFERVARWFVEHEMAERATLARVHAEAEGTLEIAAPRGPFVVTAKADRIEELTAGGLKIIDYKTGVLPAPGEVRAGLSPQLPVEAAIAEAGGFADVAAAAVCDLAHWKLSGASPPGEKKSVPMKDGAATAAARAGLERLIAAFDDPAVSYHSIPRRHYRPRFNDYEHLSRIREWTTAAEDEDT